MSTHRRTHHPELKTHPQQTRNDPNNTPDVRHNDDVDMNVENKCVDGVAHTTSNVDDTKERSADPNHAPTLPSTSQPDCCPAPTNNDNNNIAANDTNGDGVENNKTNEIVDESVLGLWFNLLLSDARGRLAAIRRSKNKCQKLVAADSKKTRHMTKQNQCNNHNRNATEADGHSQGHELAAIGAARLRLFNEMDSSLSNEEEDLENYIEQVQRSLNNTIGNAVAVAVDGDDKETCTADGNNEMRKPEDESTTTTIHTRNNKFTIKKTEHSVEAASSVQQTLQSIITSAKQTSSSQLEKNTLEHKNPPQKSKRSKRDRSGQYSEKDYLKLLGYDSL